MAAAALAELEHDSPKRRFTVGITDDVTSPLARRRPGLHDRAGRRRPRRLLRPRRRRHRRGQPQLDQDHRRGDGPARSGLLRARLEEGGLDDRLAPALRAATDRLDVSRAGGRLRRLPPVRVPRPDRRARASPADGATFLLNAPYGPDEVWEHLPADVQSEIIAKQLRLWVVDATGVAREAGLGKRVNTVLQTCFFALADVLPLETGDRRDQGRDPRDVCEAWRSSPRAELRRGRPSARGARRGRGSGGRRRQDRATSCRRRRRATSCAT